MGLPALSSLLFWSGLSRAESPCDPTRDHVTVSFVGNWTEEVKSAALSDLSAALGPKRVGVCADEVASAKSVARVVVELLDQSRVRIEVDDSLTDKLVSRSVQVEDATENSSGLIVAVAIDELLLATWAELSIKREEPKDEPVIPVQQEISPAEVRPKSSPLPTHRIALEGAVDAYVVGSVLFGANVVYGGSIGGVAEWDAFSGPRFVRAKNASDLGQVRADAVAVGLSLRAPLIRTSKFVFGPELGFAATHAWFRGRATTGDEIVAADEEFQGWALSSRIGLSARLQLSGVFVSTATRVGFPVVALEVRDESEVVGGMTGLEWSNGLSLGWWWP